MKREQALRKACFLLRKQDKEENLARFLLMYMLGETSIEFNSRMEQELSKKIERKYFSFIEDHILTDKPLSHLLGFDYFYGRKFFVNNDVLSPRMETEEIVYSVINYINRKKLNDIKILDLCTGSGVIAITLEKELICKKKIFASDISEKALLVARKNAKNLQADINFLQSDIFTNIYGNFDIIVSNPPYISYDEVKSLKNNVLNYDPHLSLFAEEDGMYFYRKILEQAKNYLKKNGIIFFEIGYNQKENIIKLAIKNNFTAEVLKDINGKYRIAIIRKRL